MDSSLNNRVHVTAQDVNALLNFGVPIMNMPSNAEERRLDGAERLKAIDDVRVKRTSQTVFRNSKGRKLLTANGDGTVDFDGLYSINQRLAAEVALALIQMLEQQGGPLEFAETTDVVMALLEWLAIPF